MGGGKSNTMPTSNNEDSSGMCGPSAGFSFFNLQKARPFIWEDSKAKKLLDPAQIETLTK